MRSLLLLPFFWAGLLQAQSTLRVEVILNRSEAGKVSIALCKGESQFADVTECIGRSVSADSEKMLIEFEGLTPGEYAIKVLHDINSNGRMDMGFLGTPKEPYGFSNDPKVTIAEPSYEDARFTVRPGNSTIRINMKG